MLYVYALQSEIWIIIIIILIITKNIKIINNNNWIIYLHFLAITY